MKVRCSILGNIFSEAKGNLTLKQAEKIVELEGKESLTPTQQKELEGLIYKRQNPKLSDTLKSTIDDIWIQDKYGRRKEISNKYLTKGIYQEDESIELLGRVDETMYFKNESNFENKYITGTPDIIMKGENKVIDIKSSWDIHTFHNSKLTPLYEWQLKGYMWLLGYKKAELCYCLVNAPQYMIDKEIDSLIFKYPFESIEELQEREYKIYKNMTFDDIPEKDRVKRFDVALTKDDIELIKNKVTQAREYYKTIKL